MSIKVKRVIRLFLHTKTHTKAYFFLSGLTHSLTTSNSSLLLEEEESTVLVVVVVVSVGEVDSFFSDFEGSVVTDEELVI